MHERCVMDNPNKKNCRGKLTTASSVERQKKIKRWLFFEQLDLKEVLEAEFEKYWKQSQTAVNQEEIKSSPESVLHVSEWNEAEGSRQVDKRIVSTCFVR